MLGPLEVRDEDFLIDLGAPRIRAMCGLLLVRAGELVAIDWFVDELWPEQPPPDARSLVRGYVSRLRRALRCGPSAADRLVTRKPGYLLRVEDNELDSQRFERLLSEARAAVRAGEPGRGVGLFRQAHALWRGDPFADVPHTASLAATATWLTEQRLAAREECFNAALAVAPSTEVVTELTGFVTAHPLRERAVGQLMLALYRSGRQAEALEQYQRIQHALAEDVGIDPGADLRQLHQRVLNADPALNPPTGLRAIAELRTPRLLPRDLPTFVSRARELTVLDTLLGADGDGCPAPMIVLHGTAGVGKSALAVHAAHLAAHRFPDGQLHVNLRGATPDVKPLSAAEALHQLLRALNVAGTAVPADVHEAAALFRSEVADRRLLIVLDNAASAAQVRPLLPGCAVVITSRIRLVALEGATHVHVSPLSPDAGYSMLEGLISGVRTAADPEATRRLDELCEHLPLALHVAAARLNARPSWAVHDLVDRLADERHRLTELAAGDIALRSSLAVSHTALHDSPDPTDRNAARALRLFGLLPLTDIDVDLAAAVLDVLPGEADRIVERLLDAHLLEEPAPGRFHMHDLTRLVAHDLAIDSTAPTEQHGAVDRLLSHYLATTCRANTLAYPHRTHHPTPELTSPPVPLVNHDEAVAWLDRYHHDMVSVIRQAWLGSPEHTRLAVALALALHWYRFLDAGVNDHPGTIEFLNGVVDAAEQLGDRRSQAYAHGNLATYLSHVGQLEQACRHSAAELDICRAIGDRFGEQRALGNLGYTRLAQHHPKQAVDHLQQQFNLARDIDAPLGQAFALVNLGKAHHQLGYPSQAITMIEQGLTWYRKTGDYQRQCDALEVLARIYIDLSQFDQAIALLTRALAYARHIGYRYGEIWALTALAQAHRLSGTTDKARDYAAQALAASNNLDGIKARDEALAEYAQLPPSST